MLLRTLILLVAAGATFASATTLTFTSSYPVIGDSLVYELFQVTLTQPTATDPNWDLQVQTNYGAAIPGTSVVVPQTSYGEDSCCYSMGDFLIVWNNVDYGIVLATHDGYTAGYLYESPNGFQTSEDVLGVGVSPRPSEDVWLQQGGSLADTSGNAVGIETGYATPGANGANAGLYTIDDQFSAPAGFLVGDFSIIMTSYVCANGLIIGNGQFPQTPTPEPGTILQCIAAGLLIGYSLCRRALRTKRCRPM